MLLPFPVKLSIWSIAAQRNLLMHSPRVFPRAHTQQCWPSSPRISRQKRRLLARAWEQNYIIYLMLDGEDIIVRGAFVYDNNYTRHSLGAFNWFLLRETNEKKKTHLLGGEIFIWCPFVLLMLDNNHWSVRKMRNSSNKPYKV